MKFRRRPLLVEALRFHGDFASAKEIMAAFMSMEAGYVHASDPRSGTLRIKTLEGLMMASPGDWIVRVTRGEFYPCKPDIFRETYEPVP